MNLRDTVLDYESLKKIKPDIIMISSCLMGQTGPMAKFAGFGNLAAALTGFFNLTGWPDRIPAGPFSAYTDYVAPRFTAIAILAALDHLRRTGQGQYIDQSQAEATLHFLNPAVLDYTVNGHVQEAMGNRDLYYAPHGVYPAAGTDRWVTITVKTEEQWKTLCEVMQRPDLVGDARFATRETRLTHQDELDAIIGEWTKQHDPYRVEVMLQARSVSAGAVSTMHETYKDPQLAHRNHFVQLDHPTHGTTTIEGSRIRLSRTPAQVQRCAPTIGRDNQHVLEQILGYSEDKITELVAAGALE